LIYAREALKYKLAVATNLEDLDAMIFFKLCLITLALSFFFLTANTANAQAGNSGSSQPPTSNSEALNLYNEGVVLAGKRQEPEALRKYKQALELDANFSMAQYASGCVLLEMGQPAKAASSFLKSLEKGYNAANCWQGLESCYSQMGDLKSMLNALKNYRKLSAGNSRVSEIDRQIKFLEAQINSATPSNIDAPDYFKKWNRQVFSAGRPIRCP